MNLYLNITRVIYKLAISLRTPPFLLYCKGKLSREEMIKLNLIYVLSDSQGVRGCSRLAASLNFFSWVRVLKIFMALILSTVGSCVHATIFHFYDGLVATTGTSFSEACNKMGMYYYGDSWSSGPNGSIHTFTAVNKTACERNFFATCHASLVGTGNYIQNLQLDFSVGCQEEFKAVQLSEIEPLSCSGAPQTAANPIKIASGAKVQPEHLVFDGFSVDYQFDSSAGAGLWQQKPDEIRRGNSMEAVDISSSYPTKGAACTSGLAELQRRAPANSWIRAVTAEYTCTCLLKKNGQAVSALGIVDAGEAGVTATSLDVLQYKHSSGALTNYVRDCSSSQYKSFSPNVRDIIQIDANGLFQIQTAGGKKTFNANGQLSATYNSAGQLENRYGYNALGDLISVHDEQGQQFIYNFTNGLLNSIQSPGGKTLQFNYSGTLLNKVIHPDQSTRIYHYEDTRFPKYLTGITDERGVRYATWKYDDQGRAISSEHAGGAEKTSLNFNSDGSTTVTNALGKKTTYSFADILGVRRVSKVTGEPTASCVGAYQSYTYTPQGQVETKTDWNGNVTRFTYDFFGRELTKTLAYGTAEAKAIQTCWHPTLNQPSRIIEPTKITLFDYTATGQLKSQIVKPHPAGAVDCSTAL